MRTSIQPFSVTEGNLRADKDTSDFGGPNMWHLKVKRKDGFWENVQWMGVYGIQQFFTEKLPVYKEPEEKRKKYQLED
jgi:hypothetical protein